MFFFLSIFLLLGCSNETESQVLDVFESAEVKAVKNGSLEICPNATVGEMADAFLSNPSWRDFESIESGTVVELTGGFSYDGKPANALVQFTFDGLSFQAAYLGINGVDQNLLVMSALFQKMCSAT